MFLVALYLSDLWAMLAGAFLLCSVLNVVFYLLGRLPQPDCAPLAQRQHTPSIAGATILICARNEARQLRRHLPQVLGQVCSFPFEVLVVNDASADDTSAVLLDMSSRYPHLRALQVQHKTHPGKKQALTLGATAARYGLIVLTDADCQPQSEHWLQRMADTLQTGRGIEVVLGYGGYRTAGRRSLLHRWIQFETMHTAWVYFSCAAWGMPYMGVGRNLAWTKRLFQRSGGVRAHWSLASGDDDLFVNAAATSRNVALNLCPEAFTWSEPKHSWGAWWQQKRRHLQAGSRYRWVHRLMLGALAFTQVAHYGGLALLSLGPWAGMAWAVWALRILLLLCAWRLPLKAFGEKPMLPLVPLFDAGLALYWAGAAAHLAFKWRAGQQRW